MNDAKENMASLLIQLRDLTSEIIMRLPTIDEEELITFVEQRGILIENMEKYRSNVGTEEKQLISELLDADPLILKKLNDFKKEAGYWLEKQGTIRVQQNAYQHHYINDSFFVDHRK